MIWVWISHYLPSRWEDCFRSHRGERLRHCRCGEGRRQGPRGTARRASGELLCGRELPAHCLLDCFPNSNMRWLVSISQTRTLRTFLTTSHHPAGREADGDWSLSCVRTARSSLRFLSSVRQTSSQYSLQGVKWLLWRHVEAQTDSSPSAGGGAAPPPPARRQMVTITRLG